MPTPRDSRTPERRDSGTGSESGGASRGGRTSRSRVSGRRRSGQGLRLPRVAEALSPWLIALLCCLCLGATLVKGLRHPSLDQRTLRLDLWSTDNPRFLGAPSQVRSMPLPPPEGGQRGLAHEAVFSETKGFSSLNARSITLFFDVSRLEGGVERPATTALLKGEITDLQTGRRWEARLSGDFRTEKPIEFFRVRSTNEPVQAASGAGQAPRWWLALRTSDEVIVGIRSHAFEGDPERTPNPYPGEWVAQSLEHGESVHWIYPIGSFTTEPLAPPVPRAELIAQFWGIPVDRLWLLLSAVLGLFLAGVLLLSLPAPAAPTTRFLQVGLGTALVFVAAGGIQLLLHPPFQGPDEQNHVGSALLAVDDRTAFERYLEFGKKVHFDRLHGRPQQKLTTSDLSEPADFFIDSVSNWGDNADAAKRSAMNARYLSGTAPLLRGLPTGEQVIRMRFLGLGVVAVAVFVAAVLLSRELGRRAGSSWAGWCFLAVPSLAFFSSSVSNYSLLVACYVIAGTLLACLVHGARVDRPLMFLLGVSVGVMVHASVNGVVMMSAVATALLGLALFPEVNPTPGPSGAITFAHVGWQRWASLAAGLLLPRLLTTPGYDHNLWEQIGSKVFGALGIPALPYPLIALGAVLGLAVIEQASLRHPIAGRRPLRRLVSTFAKGTAVLLLAGLLFNSVTKAPQLGPLPEIVLSWDYLPDQGQLLAKSSDPLSRPAVPSTTDYTRNVLGSFLASWGPGDADYMTSRLFWEANGYLDTFLPGWIRQGLTTVFAAGLILLLWRIANQKDLYRLGRLSFVLIGILGALALMACGAISATAKPSIHGRYLIGVYLLLIPVTYLGCIPWISDGTRRHPVLLTLAMAATITAIQAAAILNTLSRFYG